MRTLALIPLLLLCTCATPGGLSTLEELRRQPAIDLDGGVRARVALDRDRCESGTGVHLYCLTENFIPGGKGSGRRLGPFEIRLSTEPEDRSLWEIQAARPEENSRERLFMMLLPIPEPGDVTIQIRLPKGRTIASLHVTADPPVDPPWMPWGKSQKPGELREQDPGEPRSGGGDVANPAAGLALPQWSGAIPLAGLPAALPRLLPDRSDPDFRLTKQGNDLQVRSTKDFLVVRPDWHFLCRWWVNGLPFRPGQVQSWEDQNGMIVEGTHCTLRMDFDPARLHAGRGDRIGLQLLYCQSGWEFTGPLLTMSATHGDGPDVRMTNRIEWIAP